MRRLIAILIAILTLFAYEIAYTEVTDGGILTRTIAYETTDTPVSVYRDPELTEYWGKLPAYTICKVTRSSNGITTITYKGKTGYISSNEMSPIISGSYVYTTGNAFVYQAPNKSSKKLRLRRSEERRVG